jgi:undecaprenyl diphosphate synthase
LQEIKKKPLPRHVAIIMDGNGRWARERGLPRLAGHRAGAKAVRRTIETAAEIGLEYLTLYTFSVENWQRPQAEVKGLLELIEHQLKKEINELHSNNVRLRVVGRLEEMPLSLQKAFQEAMELTASNTGLNLNIALNYGARIEIIDAINQLIDRILEGKERTPIDVATFTKYLYTKDIPDPELLIRTSGELRVSNFLLWQIAYTEIWVTPVLWPEFNRREFLKAIYDFQNRERRFGRVSD